MAISTAYNPTQPWAAYGPMAGPRMMPLPMMPLVPGLGSPQMGFAPMPWMDTMSGGFSPLAMGMQTLLMAQIVMLLQSALSAQNPYSGCPGYQMPPCPQGCNPYGYPAAPWDNGYAAGYQAGLQAGYQGYGQFYPQPTMPPLPYGPSNIGQLGGSQQWANAGAMGGAIYQVGAQQSQTAYGGNGSNLINQSSGWAANQFSAVGSGYNVVNQSSAGGAQVSLAGAGVNQIAQVGGSNQASAVGPGDNAMLQVGAADTPTTQVMNSAGGQTTAVQIAQNGQTSQSVTVEGGQANVLQVGGNSLQARLQGTTMAQVRQQANGNFNNLCANGGDGHTTFEMDGRVDRENNFILVGGKGGNEGRLNGGEKMDLFNIVGGQGGDHHVINTGGGDDIITYRASAGNNRIEVNGKDGSGNEETFKLASRGQSVTVRDKAGNVLFKQGDGGSEIILDKIDHLEVIENGSARKIF